jgi:hypothetical protein
MSIDASNTIYTTGSFGGTADFDPDAGVYNLTSIGVADIFISKIAVPVGLKENTYSDITSVYPNPNNGSFKLKIDHQINKGELILINSVGQKVYEKEIFQGMNDINTIDLSIGLYNYILVLETQEIFSGKLSIE